MMRRKPESAVKEEVEEEEAAGTGLKKVLSFPAVILFGFSSVVGSGIFRSSGEEAFKYSGPSIWLSYVLGTTACILTGVCYIDFSMRLPSAGGAYTFVYTSLGEGMAFIAGISLTLEYGLSAAASARGASGYIKHFIASARSVISGTVSSADPGLSTGFISLDYIAPVLCVLLTCLCLLGMRAGTKVSSFVSSLNIFLIFLIIAAAGSQFDSRNFQGPMFAQGDFRSAIRATANIIFTLIGWDSVCCLSEEVENPKKVIPKATAIVLGLVGTLYCIMSVVLIGLVAHDKIDINAPFAAAFANAQNPNIKWMSWIASIGVILCSCNSVYACIVGQPRIWYGMARDGLLPQHFRSVRGKENTPVFAILVTGALTIIFSALVEFAYLQGLISAGVLLLQAFVCIGSLFHRLSSSVETQSKPSKMFTKFAVVFLCLASLGMGLSLLGPEKVENGKPIVPPASWEVFIACSAVAFISAVVVVVSASTSRMRLFIPLLAIWANMFFMGSLEYTALAFFALLCVACSPLYFFYGISHSALGTVKTPSV